MLVINDRSQMQHAILENLSYDIQPEEKKKFDRWMDR